MPNGLTLRQATPDDAPVIAEIYGATMVPGDLVWTPADLRAQIQRFTAREGYVLLERPGAALGVGLFKRYSHRNGYRFCAETAVFVRPEAQHQGHGSLIMQALLDRCATHRYHHLLARIDTQNLAALALYRAFRYETVGVQREICYRDGRWQDVQVLQRLLGDGGTREALPGDHPA